jgi:hypothetical protein
MRRIALIVSLLSLAVAGTAFAFRAAIKEAVASRLKPTLPVAVPYLPPPAETATTTPAEPTPAPAPAPTPAPAPKPPASTSGQGVNLAVPFTSQAPKADWSLPYQEACEEASMIMVNAYYKGTGAFTPDEADRQILALVAWEKDTFGFYEDTTADEVARIGREYYGYKNTSAVAIRSIDDVKKQVALGVPVILPAAGRLLHNPYFSGQGPLYHMLVVKGYTKDGKIITDDPGTRRGADYLYDPAVLWNAVHDWNGGDVEHGRKVMVVVKK